MAENKPIQSKIDPIPKYVTSLSPEGMANRPPVNAADGHNINWTVDPSVELPVKIGTNPKCLSSLPPTTVLELFNRTVTQFGDRPALRVKRNGRWMTWNYLEYLRDVRLFAKAAIKIGMPRHATVSIIGFNSPEWVIANMGAIFAGGMAAGIYTTNGAEATWYVAHHSDSCIAVTEDSSQTAKFIATKSRLPLLKCIVQYAGTVTPEHKAAGVVSWAEFLQLGESVTDAELQDRLDYQKPGHCCMLIYTSGTTGNPKAVMLSHDNITWTSSCSLQGVDINQNDRLISYLPLSHVAAQLLDIYIPLNFGASISFAQPDALKGSLVETLQDVRPTIFFGVPRVWEKIEEKMRAVGAANGAVKQMIGNWAKSVGLAGNYAKLNGEPLPWGWSIADKVIFANIKKALGLDQTKLRATSAAPISKETLEYFMSLDLPILEIYGMSESSGPHTRNTDFHQQMFSVGAPFPGAYHKLENMDAKGNGEICMWGRHIFMGYMKAEEATRNTISPDGFMHTGDLGRVDERGFLYITGRIKELIITAGGENVAPVLIEDTIKAELPVISNVMVIGDKRKFLTAIMTLKNEPDKEGNPSQVLSEPVVNWLKDNGVDAVFKKTTIADVKTNPVVLKALQAGMNKANNLAISAAQRIQKWALIDQDFSIATDELTPTMKLKRRVVNEKYAALIESFYAEDVAPKAKL